MSFVSLKLDGAKLKKFDAPGMEGVWRTLEVPIGEDVYFVDIKKTTPGTHTMPFAEQDWPPSHDEVAEVVGALWVAMLGLEAVALLRGGGQ